MKKPASRSAVRRVLSIDIGATGMKAAIVDRNGKFVTERRRVKTPPMCPPRTMVKMLVDMVKTFDDYRARLAEQFVVLDRAERRARIVRELEIQAGRLGVRVHRTAVAESGLLDEVPDLVEYPSVVAGHFVPEFLELPEEVLTTTMIHHQHWFPVSDGAG